MGSTPKQEGKSERTFVVRRGVTLTVRDAGLGGGLQVGIDGGLEGQLAILVDAGEVEQLFEWIAGSLGRPIQRLPVGFGDCITRIAKQKGPAVTLRRGERSMLRPSAEAIRIYGVGG